MPYPLQMLHGNHPTINIINKLLPFAKKQGHWNLIKALVDFPCSVNNASSWFMPMLAFVIRSCAFPDIIPHIIWRGHHINLLIWTLQFIWHKGPVHQCYLANILRQYKQRRVMMTFCKRVYNWLFDNSVVYESIMVERQDILCKLPYPMVSHTIVTNKTINEKRYLLLHWKDHPNIMNVLSLFW